MTSSMLAPESPPELTSSKSSKSSSFRSSSLSGADGALSDLAHFEDIGLNDEHTASGQDPCSHSKSAVSVSSLRRASSIMNGSRSPPSGAVGMRELTNGINKPHYPPLHGQIRHANLYGAALSLNLPNGQGTKRRVQSPSSPSLAMAAIRKSSQSRSPSPRNPRAIPDSPWPPAVATPDLRPSTSLSVRRSSSRRGSWQPSRKTAKELEDEYRDSDEDLPDDASLWNVPLSPSLYRTASNAASANPSPGTSPERPGRFSASISRGVNGIRSIHSAPTCGQPLCDTPDSIAPSPGIPPGTSPGIMPEPFNFSKTHSKSWTAALFELSEEAQSLSEALEVHAAEADSKQDEGAQPGVSSARPSMAKMTRSKTNVVELPPLRKNDVMIDPLPVSKEKEKVLSRTRPSWLPPKNQKEEKKHLKEYQQIMEMSIEAERKKAAKAASIQCARDDTKATLLRIWGEHVLPNWDQAIREPRTRGLFWRGIASRSRAEVWRRAIGNELALTDGTYMKALQRAKNVEKEIEKDKGESVRKEKMWFDAIRRDVNVTLPELKLFQLGGPLHTDLVEILMAYSMYRSDVGYSHGTHLPAGLLLLNLHSPSQAFTSLANLLNRPLPLAFVTGDKANTDKTYALTLNLLQTKLPKLHSHLFKPITNGASGGGLGLSPAEIFEPMIRTIFLRNSCSLPASPLSSPSSRPSSSTASPGLPLELVNRIWDVLVYDGDAMVIRSCVGILSCLESSLYGSREDVLGLLGWEGKSVWRMDIGEGGGEEAFMAAIREAGKVGKG